MDTVESIEDIWDRVIPDYPIQGRFLDEVFDDVYNVLKYMNLALGVFAFVALSLALIGLFGLAAFMATQRTKEIGVRKVLGASSTQIARLLVWQFSTPVLWALLFALPGALLRIARLPELLRRPNQLAHSDSVDLRPDRGTAGLGNDCWPRDSDSTLESDSGVALRIASIIS